MSPACRIRDERPEDAAAVEALLLAAFGSAAEAELVARLRREGDLALSLVAEAEGVIVGHIAFSPMRSPVGAFGLAPLAVAEAHRRRGVGAALVREGLARTEARGATCVFVLGDPAYYSRFGFEPAPPARFASPYAGPHFLLREKAAPATPPALQATYARAFDDFG